MTGMWLQELQLIEVSCLVAINAELLRRTHGLRGMPKPPEITKEERQEPQGKNLIQGWIKAPEVQREKGQDLQLTASPTEQAPALQQGALPTFLQEETFWKRKPTRDSWSCCLSQAFSTNQAVIALQRDLTH